MRIVFVLPYAGLAGGIRVVAVYARLLKERGHVVTVVSTPPGSRPLKARLRSLLAGRGWGLEYGPGHLDGVEVEHRCLETFRPVEDRDVPDADVVVATWYETAEWVWKLSPRKGAKAYFLQHYEDWSGQPERVDATWRLPMHKIVISRWLEQVARERFGLTGLSYVPNAVDLDQFQAPARGKQPVPTVGFMYSNTAFKGCDVALAAVARARLRVPQLALRAFGSDRPGSLPPGTDFTYRPAQDRIRDVYSACDAWLFSSRSEGFGLPILEAMACRTPVIAAPAGAAPELLAQGGGILLPSADPVGMAEAIVRICELPDAEWRALSEKALQIASLYGWGDAVQRLEAALERAVAEA